MYEVPLQINHIGDEIIPRLNKRLELIKQKSHFRMPILLHFSTDEVYGDIEVGSHTETDLLKPSNPSITVFTPAITATIYTRHMHDDHCRTSAVVGYILLTSIS
mgnify:CR=1 FL=1